MGRQKQKRTFDKPHSRRDHQDQGIKAKKHLGQHFLGDETVAQDIANTLTLKGYKHVLEIGPGTGVLTKYLLEKPIQLTVMDLDKESIDCLLYTSPSPRDGLLSRMPSSA